MFNWVVKVVPQPPEVGADEAVKTTTSDLPRTREVKSPPLKTSDVASDDSQNQTGVLNWLSNGFVSALPQPAGSPRLSRANSDARSGEDGERVGVINWVAQGLTRVLPQPDDKYRENDVNEDGRVVGEEEHTEVYELQAIPDFDPLPHIPVVEMVSEDEASEAMEPEVQFPPKVVTWIKQIIPQPATLPPGSVPVEATKSSRSSLDKILSPPPESLSGISLDTDSKASGVVGWFVTGLGLKMPQPALPPRDQPENSGEVLQKGGKELRAP